MAADEPRQSPTAHAFRLGEAILAQIMADPGFRLQNQPDAETHGILSGIARRDRRRAPMEAIASGQISSQAGLHGDSKGLKFLKRQITVLSLEDWRAALADLGAEDLPWTGRRANLLVERITLPRARGAILAIGPVRLEVTGQTYPCSRMEEVRPGLLKALAPDWRGGVTCRVLEGGAIALGDAVRVLSSPQWELPLPLPG